MIRTKASISTSGSKSALKSSKKAAKKSSKAKKSDEVSIKMPATIPTPKTRKPPSRFSLRGTYTHVHIFVRFGFYALKNPNRIRRYKSYVICSQTPFYYHQTNSEITLEGEGVRGFSPPEFWLSEKRTERETDNILVPRKQ